MTGHRTGPFVNYASDMAPTTIQFDDGEVGQNSPHEPKGITATGNEIDEGIVSRPTRIIRPTYVDTSPRSSPAIGP